MTALPAASARLRELVRARAFPASPRPDALEIARSLLASAGDSVQAIVFFGSRKTRAAPDPWSAYDFFVLVRGYREVYEALRRAGHLGARARLSAALNRVLPPNQLSLSGVDAAGSAWRAKCSVITLSRFLRETSPRRRDHFCLGRMFQPAEVLYAADRDVADALLGALLQALLLTYDWSRPWLPTRFDVDEYCRTLLRVSLAQEIRPEPAGRAEILRAAQQDELRPVYATLLLDLAAAGELRAEDGRFSAVRPPRRLERLRKRLYFRWSLLRATARWLKYTVTFEGWLDYLVHKAERHSGRAIALTPRERRLPLLFLWPRVIRYLREKEKG